MSFLLNSYLRKGYSTLSRLSFYSFCTYTQNPEGRYSSSSLVGKLATKENVSDVLSTFKENEKNFGREHIAVACRSIAKNLFNEKDRRSMYDNNIIKDFCTKINDNIDSMNPIELLDVMFLVRKLKMNDVGAFSIDLKKLMVRINFYIQNQAYSMRNLISLLFSLSTLGFNTNITVNSIQKKIIEGDKTNIAKDLTSQTIAQLINGIAQGKFFTSGMDRKLIASVTNILNQNIPEQDAIDVPSSINILKGISKLYIPQETSLPFVDRIIQHISNSADGLLGNEIQSVIIANSQTNSYLMNKLANNLKDNVIEMINIDDESFEFVFIVKMLNEMANWNNTHFTLAQEQTLVKYFDNHRSQAETLDFNKLTPKFLKLISKQNAIHLANFILSITLVPSVGLLVSLNRFVDVTKYIKDIQAIRKNNNLYDTLKIEQLLHNQDNLSPQLLKFKEDIPEMIRSQFQQEKGYAVLRSFFKDSTYQSQNRVKDILLEHFLQLPENEFAESLRRNTDFLFCVINVLGRKNQQLQKKIQNIKPVNYLSKRNIKSIINHINYGNGNVSNEFWRLINISELQNKNIYNVINSSFFHKTVKNIDRNSQFVAWLKNSISNNIIIDNNLLNFALVTIESSRSSEVNQIIIDTLIANIDKLSRIDKSTMFKFIKILKRERFLNTGIAEKLANKFDWIQKQSPGFISPFLNNQEQSQLILQRIKNMSIGNLEVILLHNFPQWNHLKDQVIEFLNKEKFNLTKWRSVLTSFRPSFKKNQQYREILNLATKKFLQFANERRGQEVLNLIQILAVINPQKVQKQVVEKVVSKSKQFGDSKLTDSYLNILNLIGEEDIFPYLLKDNNLNHSQVRHIWDHNIRLPENRGRTLMKIIQTNNYNKPLLARALILNDHIPQIRQFLNNNKDLILDSNIQNGIKNYYRVKYLSETPENNNKKDLLNSYFTNKIKEIAEASNLQFEENPVVNDKKFNYRIGDNYVLVENNKRFISLPRNTQSFKMESNLEINKKLLETQTGKKVIIVPQNISVLNILQKEIPEFKSSNLKNKQQIPEVEQDVEELPRVKDIDDEEDVEPAGENKKEGN